MSAVLPQKRPDSDQNQLEPNSDTKMEVRCEADLLKYERVENISYGSTCYVFKVRRRQTDGQSLQTRNPNAGTRFEQFPMARFGNEEKERQETITSRQQQSVSDKTREDLPQRKGPFVQKQSFKIFKSYNIHKLTDGHGRLIEEVKYNLLIEMALLKELEHPGIVVSHSMYAEYLKIQNGSLSLNSNRQKLQSFGVIMEFCQKGTFTALLRYIERTKLLKDNRLLIIRFYLAQLINVLQYLNKSQGVLHRDVKAENILITKSLDLKLTDFGTATVNQPILDRFLNDPYIEIVLKALNISESRAVGKKADDPLCVKNIEQKRRNLVGSRHYISPELIQKYKCDFEMVDGTFDKTDIWSFGVLVYKIFHQRFPFEGKNLKETTSLILNQDAEAEMDESLPSEVKQLIRRCLVKDHSQRASWTQICDLSLFQGIDIENIYEVESPIISLFRAEKQKQTKNDPRSRFKQIFFEEKVLVSESDSSAKGKKRTLIVGEEIKESGSPNKSSKSSTKKAKSSASKDNRILLILKQNDNVSFETAVENNVLKLFRNKTRACKGKGHIGIKIKDPQSSKVSSLTVHAEIELIDKLRDCLTDILKV